MRIAGVQERCSLVVLKRFTTNTSPASSLRIALANSGRSVRAPEAFSLNILPQPADFSSAIWVASEQALTVLVYLMTQYGRMSRKGQIMLLRKTMIALGFIGTMAAGTATPTLSCYRFVASGCMQRR